MRNRARIPGQYHKFKSARADFQSFQLKIEKETNHGTLWEQLEEKTFFHEWVEYAKTEHVGERHEPWMPPQHHWRSYSVPRRKSKKSA
mmetsp:Transcript_5068/g.18989  ORF Transcript_5068/g.18989 Transcript_5068/m.18989 type:complete len:88 (+) Transcript_5068:103-366(+)